ncbi:MAG: hypothetical protein HS111_01330 [Kofleriaceae bacterium]|nr:hypothetical protein [Kofleriaceae bacterium]
MTAPSAGAPSPRRLDALQRAGLAAEPERLDVERWLATRDGPAAARTSYLR